MLIRIAEEKDLADLLKIYNHEVVNSTTTLDLKPKTIAQWRSWFCAHNVGNHPILVAEIDGHAIGYVSLSEYRPKEAYRCTVELSIYIHPDWRKCGVGSALMTAILEEARNDPRTHTVVSVITEGNEPSRQLHEKFGFRYCGTVEEVGEKFGRYIGIDTYRLGV